jgi:hypothetical protein
MGILPLPGCHCQDICDRKPNFGFDCVHTVHSGRDVPITSGPGWPFCRFQADRIYSIFVRKWHFVLCLPVKDFRKAIGAQFHAEAHISAQPPPPFEGSRLPHSYENKERSRRSFSPPRQGPQARLGQRRLPRLVRPSPLFHPLFHPWTIPSSKESAFYDQRQSGDLGCRSHCRRG